MARALCVACVLLASCGEPQACSAIGSGAVGGGAFGGGGAFAKTGASGPSITVTSPSASPYVSTSTGAAITLQGTTAGGPDAVTWSGTGGSGSCTVTTGAFSCPVTLTRGTTQTITIAASKTGSNIATTTKSVTEPTSWLADYSSLAVGTDPCATVAFITAKGTKAATQCNRGSVAYRDAISGGVRTLTAVSADVHRIVSRKDAGATVRTGALFEDTNIQKLHDTRDISAASWTKTNAGDTFSLNSTNGPDGASTMDGLIAAAASAQHGVTQAPTLTAATYAISAYYKAGAAGFAYVSDDTVTNGNAWFNLSTCACGTVGSGVLQCVAEDWGNSLCRVGVVVTGTAAAHTLKFLCATADNALTFTGDGSSVSCSMTRWQAEKDVYPTSSIDAASADVTRNGEWVFYPAASNWPASSQGAAYFEYFTSPRTTGKQGYLMTATQVADTSANAFFFSFDGTHHAQFFNSVAGVTQLNLTDANVTQDNGSLHHVLARFGTNTGHLSNDGLEFAAAVTAGAVATSIVNMHIGSRETGFISPDAVITKIVIQDQLPARGIYCMGDSITAGTAITTPYPTRLASDVTNEGYTVRNDGVGGSTTTDQDSRYATTGGLYSHTVIGGTVNDRFNDDTVATTETHLASLIAKARAANLKIIMFTTTPWKNGFHWDTTKQQETLDVNAWIRSQAASDLVIDDEYAQMNDPGNDGHLLAVCDSGDAVHPSQTCSDQMEQRLLAIFMGMR